MRLRFSVLLALFAVASLALPARAQAPDSVATPEWLPVDHAVTQAASGDRIVMIAALADWCPWCLRLERETFADDAVRAYLGEHYESVRLDVESESMVSWRGETLSESDLALVLGVESVPAIAVIGPDGSYITQIRGFYPPDHFLMMLRYIQEADYTVETFDQFVERVEAP